MAIHICNERKMNSKAEGYVERVVSRLKKPWGSESDVAIFNKEVLETLAAEYSKLDVPSRIAILLSVVKVSPENRQHLRSEFEALLKLGHADENEWVKSTAELLNDGPSKGFFNVGVDTFKFQSALVKSGATARLLPLESMYLSRSQVPSEGRHILVGSEDTELFTLREGAMNDPLDKNPSLLDMRSAIAVNASPAGQGRPSPFGSRSMSMPSDAGRTSTSMPSAPFMVSKRSNSDMQAGDRDQGKVADASNPLIKSISSRKRSKPSLDAGKGESGDAPGDGEKDEKGQDSTKPKRKWPFYRRKTENEEKPKPAAPKSRLDQFLELNAGDNEDDDNDTGEGDALASEQSARQGMLQATEPVNATKTTTRVRPIVEEDVAATNPLGRGWSSEQDKTAKPKHSRVRRIDDGDIPTQPSAPAPVQSEALVAANLDQYKSLKESDRILLTNFLNGDVANPDPSQPTREIVADVSGEKIHETKGVRYKEIVIFKIDYENTSWKRLRRKELIS